MKGIGSWFSLQLFGTVLAVVLSAPAWALTTPAIDFTGGSVLPGGSFLTGWRFAVNSDVTVVDLGVYDHDQDGLAGSHQIAIYSMGGTELAKTDLLAGTGVLDGLFRYQAIAPVTLFAGQAYAIIELTPGVATNDSADPYLFDPVGFTTDPRITYQDDVSDLVFFQDPQVSFTTRSDPNQGGPGNEAWFGPNFRIQLPDPDPKPTPNPNAIPEPMTSGLVLVSLLGLTLRASQRQR